MAGRASEVTASFLLHVGMAVLLPIISLFEGLPYYLNWSVKPSRVS